MIAPSKSRLDVVLAAVGLAVWAAVGSPTWSRIAEGVWPSLAWSFGYVSFAFALWRATRPTASERHRLVALAYQSLDAIALALLGMPHFEGALLAIVAVQAPALVRPRLAFAWAAAQAVPLFVIILPSHGIPGSLKATGEYATFAVFAMVLVLLRERERAARRELAHAHATLLATQSLVLDDTRQGERFRIAREVHDAIGHGLAAASIHLQLARRTQQPEAIAAAEQAVKGTLGDLRGVVGSMRAAEEVDVATALRALCADVGEPEVHLALSDDLGVGGRERAHAVFRCVQEALTNAIKHARAHHVWVNVAREGDRCAITVRDDGQGAAAVTPGHGLDGLRERMSELGGGADFETTRGGGFTLRAWLPCEDSS